jgi:hypothetical protein
MRAKLGIALIMFAIATLLVLIVLPSVITDSPLLNQFLGRLFCGSPTAYLNDSYSSTAQSSTSFFLRAACLTPDETRTDIGGLQTAAATLVFVVSLLGGIALLVSKPTRFEAAAYEGLTIQKAKRRQPNTPRESLAETLKQLDESLEAGLINPEEYDDARQRILKNL